MDNKSFSAAISMIIRLFLKVFYEGMHKLEMLLSIVISMFDTVEFSTLCSMAIMSTSIYLLRCGHEIRHKWTISKALDLAWLFLMIRLVVLMKRWHRLLQDLKADCVLTGPVVSRWRSNVTSVCEHLCLPCELYSACGFM